MNLEDLYKEYGKLVIQKKILDQRVLVMERQIAEQLQKGNDNDSEKVTGCK